jgi:hypothetical protein
VNQNDLEERLSEIYGNEFVVFHAGLWKEEEEIELFQRAKLVIGAHGGAMYHAMWASENAKIVELMPVQENGKYPGMPGLEAPPPFAHLAIYTNAMMIGQRFYRWYEISGELNFRVRIEEFVEWLKGVEEDNE